MEPRSTPFMFHSALCKHENRELRQPTHLFTVNTPKGCTLRQDANGRVLAGSGL